MVVVWQTWYISGDLLTVQAPPAPTPTPTPKPTPSLPSPSPFSSCNLLPQGCGGCVADLVSSDAVLPDCWRLPGQAHCSLKKGIYQRMMPISNVQPIGNCRLPMSNLGEIRHLQAVRGVWHLVQCPDFCLKRIQAHLSESHKFLTLFSSKPKI